MCNKTRPVLYKEWISAEYEVTETNPDGSPKVKTKVEGTGEYSGFIHEAEFLEWATDFQETNQGVGSYTTALLMLKDGSVMLMHPTHFKFVQPEQNTEELQSITQILERIGYIITTCTNEDVKKGLEQAKRVVMTHQLVQNSNT